MTTEIDYQQRFAGIRRLYGQARAERIRELHICVVGLGGVGSWAVESLARSGVGRLTLIDYDTVSAGNINRQLAALGSTLEQKKSRVLSERIRDINPRCEVRVIDDFLTVNNLEDYLAAAQGYDCVIDAIDSIKFKAAMINHCKRNKLLIITTGGAGGLTDPSAVTVRDLSRTINDPLAAKVRSRLRSDYGFTRDQKRTFGVECVFSTQQPVYPKPDGSVSCEKPGIHGISLDCNLGYGSAAFVTATFGNVAVYRALEKSLQRLEQGRPG
jgi:tRNA A37 threonylcarbamoyladenosine dehydratase